MYSPVRQRVQWGEFCSLFWYPISPQRVHTCTVKEGRIKDVFFVFAINQPITRGQFSSESLKFIV